MKQIDDNPRFKILLKEIELIQQNIKNLDDIIFKMKNFAVVFWGGSIFLIVQHLGDHTRDYADLKIKILLCLTAIFPFVFWMIHVRWQKHITMSTAREKMISYFINSSEFDLWLQGKSNINFPVFDTCGWFYSINKEQVKNQEQTTFDWENYKVKVDNKYLIQPQKSYWNLMWYKDAWWYYLFMILISFGIAFMY